MIITKKLQIFPTQLQINYFNKCFGIRRFIWNECIDRFLNIGSNEINDFNENETKKLYNSLAKSDPNYSFLNEVNSMVRQECLKDFRISLESYIQTQRYLNKKHIADPNYQTDFNFKRPTKKDECQSFRYNNKGNPVKYISKKKFWLTTTKACVMSKTNLPKYSIKTNESIEFLNDPDVRFATITIKRDFDNRYYAIFTYERTNHSEEISNEDRLDKVGIDMGIKNPLVCVNKNENDEYEYFVFKLPNSIKTVQRRIEYSQSKLTKKIKGSSNYNKANFKLKKLIRKLTNIRKEFCFQSVNYLCKNFNTIIIEDFYYNYTKEGLHCNHTMSNIGKYRFVEHLKYKSLYWNNELVFVTKGFPSTQTCSSCGNILTGNNKLGLNDRVYKCQCCGLDLDRDVNSAINIYNYLESNFYIIHIYNNRDDTRCKDCGDTTLVGR